LQTGFPWSLRRDDGIGAPPGSRTTMRRILGDSRVYERGFGTRRRFGVAISSISLSAAAQTPTTPVCAGSSCVDSWFRKPCRARQDGLTLARYSQPEPRTYALPALFALLRPAPLLVLARPSWRDSKSIHRMAAASRNSGEFSLRTANCSLQISYPPFLELGSFRSCSSVCSESRHCPSELHQADDACLRID
jgi:hypothetical protein